MTRRKPTKAADAMSVLGRARWFYHRYVKSRLPASAHGVLSRIARTHTSRGVELIASEYSYWRVKKAMTKLLGPQYTRSRSCIEIDITWACNLKCYDCNRSCEQVATGEHMTVAQVQRFVDDSVAARHSWRRIRLLGGEPTVHRDFYAILDVVLGYRDLYSRRTTIEVITNGHGEKVNGVIAGIPRDVLVNNSRKETRVQPHFRTFNIAPRDVAGYGNADFRNGCWVIEECGIGLGPYGYYPCAVAGGIDRVYGWDLGRRSLPEPGDDMDDLLKKFCPHCGHFKRRLEAPFDGPRMSETWQQAYARYRQVRPALSRYGGERSPEESTPGVHALPTRGR